MFGKGTKGSKLHKRVPLCFAVLLEGRVAARPLPELLQGRNLQSEDGITINQPRLIERLTGSGEALKRGAEGGRPRDLFNVQIQQVPIAPTTGKIGAGLLRDDRDGGM